jgi:hypothetical protein
MRFSSFRSVDMIYQLQISFPTTEIISACDLNKSDAIQSHCLVLYLIGCSRRTSAIFSLTNMKNNMFV